MGPSGRPRGVLLGAFLFNASMPVPLWVSAVEGRERLRAPGSAERFGSDALAETVADDRGLDAMLDGLLTAVRQANGGELSDDVAILCVAGSTKPLGVHGRAL